MTPAEQAALRWPAVTPEEPEVALEPGNADGSGVPRKSITHWVGPEVALGLLGLGSWAYGVSSLTPTDIGRDGLLVSGSAWLVVGLMLLLAGFLLELRRHGRSWMLGLLLIGLVVAIHGTVPIIFGAPEYAWVYKHVGIASSFQRYGRVTDPSSIYQEWPALFAAVASLSSLAHTNPLSFATWAPLAFELADALLLVALFRLLVGKRRVVWLAVLLYEGLISWVGQDYLSPQAFTYVLWLGMAVIILRWLRAPAPELAPGKPGRLARLRAPLIAGMPAAPQTSEAMRGVAVVLVTTIYVAIVAAHQLTPYMVIASVGALTLLDLVRPRWLVFLLAAIAGGYLALHYGLIAQQFGGLFSGANPLSNASGAHGTPNPSGAAIWSSRVVDLLIVGMWLTTVGVIVRCRRRLGQVAIPALLALSPFVILLAQSYGGEAIYRVYLFSAPWCALLIAGALWELRPQRRWPLAALVSVAALFAGVEGLYGPAQVNGFTSQEVNASLWMYSHISPRALIVLPVENFPALESANYNRYDIQVLPSDPQIGPSYLDEGSVQQVQNWITGLGHRTAYVIVSRSMDNWSNFYGAPLGYTTLVRELPSAFHGSIVYQNGDVKIYRVTVPEANDVGFREWVLQDWQVNATRPESQLLLAWFRLAQWAADHWGKPARLIVSPYWLIVSLVVSVEFPVSATVGPRLRLYHPHGIVLSPSCVLGSDCHLRQGVTVGNTVDREGNEIGVARVGNDVDLGAGCCVIGDLVVGDHARIGALAIVLKSVPAWAVVVGNPGRVIRIDEPPVQS